MIAPATLQHPDAFLSPLAIDEAVRRALDEDLGRAGDVTSIATIPEEATARAVMVARQNGVIAGVAVGGRHVPDAVVRRNDRRCCP